MEIVSFLLFIAFEGSLAFLTTCNNERCLSLFPQEEIFGLGRPPTSQQVLQLCPQVSATLDCALDEIQICTGKKLEELVASPNKSASMSANLIINARMLAHDLCNEESDLFQTYDAKIRCFTNLYMGDQNQRCRDEAKRLFDAYRTFINTTEEEADSDAVWEEEECLTTSYLAKCFALELGDKCGSTAQEMFTEIFFKRIKFLQLNICKPEDYVTLKSAFLDFLENQGENRNFWTEALDLRRR